MPYNPQQEVVIDEKDIQISWFSGTGAGGQHRNKTQNSCRLLHTPSGIVCTAQSRSRDSSLREAMAELKRRLTNLQNSSIRQEQSTMRKGQVGSGQRGDKIRTIQFQNNVAQDHRSGKRITAEQYMKGNMNLLW